VGSSDVFLGDDGDSPVASTFDGQVVLAHLDSEETLFTPEVTPRVSTNPVFSSVFNTPTEDGDDVVNHRNQKSLGEDTASVSFEFISSINTASNGTVGIDGLLHGIDTAGTTVVGDLPVLVVGDGSTVSTSISSGETVFTDLDVRASEVVGISGNVVLARVFGDTVFLGEFVDTSSVTTFAGTTSTTVDNGLDGKSDFGESGVSGDVDSISQGRGTSLSPARSAVNGDVLVLGPRNIVSSVDVSPIPSSGEIRSLDVSPREFTSERGLSGVLQEIDLGAALRASLGENIF